ncbi:MAG: HAMP domain-containing sensor histidine kinase, partial [Oscillospiraceae bacterium]|nr:HAMP domain-containing sensor histidine kinase [Oscillospiraceae bacterium]
TGEILMQSRDGLICTTRINSEKTELPLVFQEIGSEEVKEVFWFLSGVPKRDGLRIQYYQSGHQYIIHRITCNDFTYQSDASIPEGAVLQTFPHEEHIVIAPTPVRINYGTAFSGSGVQSPTRNVRDLLDKYSSGDLSKPPETPRRGLRNLFKTEYYFTETISDRQSLFSPESGSGLFFVYCISYSPLAIAVKTVLTRGVVVWFYVLILLYMEFMWYMIRRFFNRELCSCQDEITRQRQALKYAEDAERSRRDMTSAIAHELKTPLAVLSSYTEALQENIDPAKQGHYLSVIREEAEKMDQMVLELLDLSRLEAGRYKLDRQYFDLKDLTEEILQPLMPQIEEKQILVKWNVHTVLFYGDRKRFGQVVENFLTNAIRHTPEGGTIVIRIGGEQTFSVENTGAQLPPDQLTKVWEAFWQGDASRQQKGTGLGLAICKTILELHGGSCKAENTPNGVNFIADLSPAKPDPINHFPKDDVIELEYMIAQEKTTLLSVFTHLSLLSKSRLRQEIRAGAITCPGVRITSPNTKLRTGNRIIWKEYRITIIEENLEKRRTILHNRLSAGGGLASTSASDAILGVRR